MSKLLIPLFIVLLIVTAVGAFFIGTRRSSAPSPSAAVSATPTIESRSPSASPTATSKTTKTSTPTPTSTSAPTATPTPTPTPDNRADLYISAYSFNHAPVMGEAFTVSVTIYNQGNVASGNFFWEWWATTSAPTWACRENVPSIATHGGRVVTCTYTYGGWANYTTKAIADVDNGVDESNEGNNTYSQSVIPIH